MQRFCSPLLLVALFVSSAAHAIDISFQGRTYAVTTVNLADDVPLNQGSDLIFVSQSGLNFLQLPSADATRGDYDPGNQRFYVVDRSGVNNGSISAFNSLSGALIKPDGTLHSLTLESPSFPAAPLEVISRPLAIPGTNTATDICIVDDTLFGYRTDGITGAESIVYTFTRQTPANQQQFNVLPRDSTPALIEFDPISGNYILLLVRAVATSNPANASIAPRFSAVTPAGVIISEISLDPALNNAFATLTAQPTGMALDPVTGTIYLLDSAGRKVFVVTPRVPAIFSVNPAKAGVVGGISISINGVNLPSDAKVFLGGTAATSISVAANGASITATAPAHALGIVDVTVTGSGIPTATSLTLVAAFEYTNTVPAARLDASPTTGDPPLLVGFVVTGSNDPDGIIVGRVLDFGDGDKFTFPADLTVERATHSYTTQGTYVATLTVTDNLGGSSQARVTIVVGSGDLVVRSLTFSISDKKNKDGSSKDTLKLTGEFVMPENENLASALLSVAFVKLGMGGADLVPCPAEPILFNAFDRAYLKDSPAASIGGRYCVKLDANEKIIIKPLKFSRRPLKTRGFTPNTQSFSFSANGFALSQALMDAGLFDANGKPVDSIGGIALVIRVEQPSGQVLEYQRPVVVAMKSGRSTSIKLTRR